MRWDFVKITPLTALILAASLAGQTRQPCAVARVLDNCRVELASGEIVQLIGLQNFPNSSSQFKSLLDSLLIGKSLWLEIGGKAPAGFGYLWHDSLLLNVELLRQGWARVWDDTAQFKYQESFFLAEHKARTMKRGNWQFATFLLAAVDEATPVIDDTVYVTPSGKKYHRADCRLLSKNRMAMPLSRAQINFSACRLCQVSATSSATAQSLQQTEKIVPARCLAKTKNGDRCKREAEPDSKYCWQHRRK
ncbi:MAG: thermonuclease family protein [candidate division KSB1 bacterium]|nr:thermonuclease family protein [candidate division KSB1 bacterium]MDZ7366044.1 thermonuclease family protein [candidate division KSB1 bacterium]MDZ7404161.1 thermonuclease family protein [candidate division KSB1 bacterium]